MNILLKDLLRESAYDRGLFKAIFFSGIPGSGKSYVLSKISDGKIEPRVVNTDKMVEFYSKQFNIDINSDQYYNYFSDSVKRVTVNQLGLYINSLLPLFVDGTSNSLKSLFKREGILKSFGYDTGMVWINTDLETAIKRSKNRNRFVPEEFIVKVHESLNKNKEYYKTHFSFFQEVNNNDDELTSEAILMAYKRVSGFFNSEVKNPIGIQNMEIAKKTNSYLVPNVYESVGDIQRNLIGWYSSIG